MIERPGRDEIDRIEEWAQFCRNNQLVAGTGNVYDQGVRGLDEVYFSARVEATDKAVATLRLSPNPRLKPMFTRRYVGRQSIYALSTHYDISEYEVKRLLKLADKSVRAEAERLDRKFAVIA